jgi:hypothetical protein
MLRDGRMAALVKLRSGIGVVGERRLRAVPYERPEGLDFNSLRNCQGVFKLNAKISHCAVHLGVTK